MELLQLVRSGLKVLENLLVELQREFNLKLLL